MNGVRVNTVDIGGPYSPVTGPSPESLRKIYTCGHLNGGHQSTCAKRIVTSLARRAFRRPVAAGEVDKIVALVHQAQEQEDSFEEGLAVGIQALLVSPDFLFRMERDRPAVPASSVSQPISSHELATRLSYFLWASMPDAELRRVADNGTLRNPVVRAAQVRRMLRDPKARALAENFGGQWLQFRALESTTRDRERFPEFEDYLRLSMRRETELFFEHIIREDRSILDFLDGRYTFINERLAKHYGIPNVSGPQFRRVDLTDTPRGGVLTQGSVLTVSSYATRTSPVLRGKWVLDNLLGRAARRSAGRRAEPRRVGDRDVGFDAGAAGDAPQEPDLRLVPPPDGPARVRPREFRRRRGLADNGREIQDRLVRHAAGRRGLRGPGRTAGDSQGRA